MFRSLTISIVLACCLSAETASISVSHRNPRQSAFIEAGVGIAGVTIGKSSMSDVVAMYGDNFKLIEHNEYSDEIRYAELGLSFWYCHNDPDKRIFCIEVKSPCYGVTSKGVIMGESTAEDVFRLYGEPDEHYGGKYTYKGIQFYYESEAENGEEESGQSSRKIVTIDVVPPDKDSNFCDGI